MPPQRTSRKLNPQAQHALIRKYRISIDGPVRRRDWPPRYAPLFGLVRDMEKIEYEEYATRDYGSDDVRLILVSKMCNRVEKLVTQAHALRESLDNEETWRLKTEHLILERFEAAVDCHICADRRWISDFQAIPSCPEAAERLQDIRHSRKLCQYSESMRAKLLAEASSQTSFVTKGSCTVVDKSMAEIQKKMLAHHRPDRVLGLGRTPELEHLLAASPSIPRTVVGEDTDMYFPFLVLEAKSEKNSVGFESIERQTVFPIRAMLDLQRNLETASNVQFDPLVWFLANRGDEWRVYACVPHRAHTKIIDLWHGSILRHDSALQLLLVIDLLCDWPREIFLERIMKIIQEQAGPDFLGLLSHNSVESIAPMQDPLRDSTLTPPRVTTEATSSPQPEPSTFTGREIVVKPEAETVVIDGVPHISTGDTPTAYDSTMEPPARGPSMQPIPISAAESRDRTIIPDGWPGHLALRSQFDVQLRFRSLSLPESAHDLSALLATIDGKDKITQTGIRLLESFNLGSPLRMEPVFIDRIRHAWGEPECPLRPEGQPVLYACLHWRTTIDYADWVVTNEIACITASEVAMGVLAYISHIPGVQPSGGVISRESVPSLIHDLRRLPLPELVQAAARKEFLHLRNLYTYDKPRNRKDDSQKEELFERLWQCRDTRPKNFSGCLENICTVVRGKIHLYESDDEVEIPPALQVPEAAKECQFALLRVPPTVKARYPPYCVYVFGSPSPSMIGRGITSLIIEPFSCFYGTDQPLTELDRKYLTQTSRALMNLDSD